MPPPLKLEGAKELERKLNNLPVKVQKNVLRKAVRAGMAPIRKAARSKGASDTGTLRSSLKSKFKLYRGSSTYVGITGPEKSVVGPDGRRPAFYAHLVELGFTHRNGITVPAQPFMRPAFDEQKDAAIAQVREKMATEIIKEASK